VTLVFGNSRFGGTSGPDGHRVVVNYSIVGQSIAGNYTDIYWQYGVDYGDPNYWNNISNRSIAWSVDVGSSVSGVSGYGTGTSSSPYINTSDPGYGGQIHYFWSGTVRIYHNSNGQGTIHLNASMTFSTGAYTSSINTNIELPNIIRPPSAPTALTATRINDGQINLAWANHSDTFTAYSNVKVYRSTDGAGFALIATLGVVTTYSDNTTSANHRYRYKVEAVNAAGSAQSGISNSVWTTPGTPTVLTATKLAGGNIRLNWSNNVNYTEYTVRIEESQDGGAYSEITNVAAGTTQWDHVAPNPAVTHRYRIRARTSSGTTLNSNYSNQSATIVLLSTAGPPTGLSPSGATLDATEDIVFTWSHNPTDSTPQSKYQLQYKVGTGTYTTVGPIDSTVSSFTLPAATLANGNTITWRVATAGENGTIGAYSAESSFTTQDRPTSVISVPAGSTHTQSTLTAKWTYFQVQSSPQTAWHAFLYLKGALPDFSDATLVGEEAGSGTTDEVTFSTTLLDGETYGVRVYVTSASGLKSIDAGTDLQEFTVTYLPPANVTLTASYDSDLGQMVITIIGSVAEGGSTEPIDTVDLQRQIDGGEWVTWATGIVLSVGSLVAILVDTMPTVHGVNKYRAIVRSAVPSSALSAEVEVTTSEPRWGFLSSFQGNFADTLRMRARLTGRSVTGRSKAVYGFAGRDKPVELSGEETSKSYAVAATLYGTSSTPAEVEAMGETTGIVLWRDYTGRRMFASISPVTVDYNTDSVLFPVSFTLTRVDYDENIG
jgi:hypothetical protein